MTNNPNLSIKRARALLDGNALCTILATHGDRAWVIFDGEDWPATYLLSDLEMEDLQS